MKPMNPRTLVLLGAAAAALCLAGCARSSTTVTVEKNGDVTVETTTAFADSVMDMMSEDGDYSAFLDEDEIADYAERGISYAPYAEDDYSGYTLTRSGLTLEDLCLSDGEESNLTDVESGFFTKNGNTYTLDLPALTDEDAAEAEEYISYLNQLDGYITFTLVLPVKPDSSNATTVSEDGKTLTWSLLDMVGENVQAQFTLKQSHTALICGICGACAVVIAGGAAVVVLKKNKKKTEAPVETDSFL